MSAEFQNKISHSQFNGPGFVFMASDGPESRVLNPDEGNVSISLAMPEPNEARRVFEALSDGGHIRVPLEHVSWGGKLGVLQDRFATEWIITTT
jgi:PhnB protein